MAHPKGNARRAGRAAAVAKDEKLYYAAWAKWAEQCNEKLRDMGLLGEIKFDPKDGGLWLYPSEPVILNPIIKSGVRGIPEYVGGTIPSRGRRL